MEDFKNSSRFLPNLHIPNLFVVCMVVAILKPLYFNSFFLNRNIFIKETTERYKEGGQEIHKKQKKEKPKQTNSRLLKKKR